MTAMEPMKCACGGRAMLESERFFRDGTPHDEHFFVECCACKTRGPMFSTEDRDDADEKAVESWNDFMNWIRPEGIEVIADRIESFDVFGLEESDRGGVEFALGMEAGMKAASNILRESIGRERKEAKAKVLRPCPFCGGEAEIVPGEHRDGECVSYCAHVMCTSCGARTGEVDEHEPREFVQELAAYDWNRRGEGVDVGALSSVADFLDRKAELSSTERFGTSKLSTIDPKVLCLSASIIRRSIGEEAVERSKEGW